VPPAIEQVDADTTSLHEPALVALIQEMVDTGASIGFLPPLSAAEAAEYWRSVSAAQRAGSRRHWIAREAGGRIVGSVQLDLATRANACHRAEVQKLMVATAARRRGLARALMLAAEAEARRLGRTTLVLDTRQGDPSEALYRGLGWTLAGVIPKYAESAGGALDASAFYFKLLEG